MVFWGCVVVLLLTIKKIQMGSGHDACYPFLMFNSLKGLVGGLVRTLI
jgi:hypothetical protein